MKEVSIIVVADTKPSYIDEGDVTVAVDVIRCSTTIIYAFLGKVEYVIPAGTIAEAKRLAKATPNSFLVGEREGVKIRGFDFNNSPTEMENANIKGKNIIITTSHGAKLIKLGMKRSKVTLIGALINAKACAEAAYRFSTNFQSDVRILIPWMKGGFAVEDLYTAGLISTYLIRKGYTPLFDTAKVGQLLATLPQSRMMSEIKSSWSVRRILEIGYEPDIERCLTYNSTDLVPYSSGERLKTHQ
ncbi:MAG: 2-phosphosulfolactate phosphatase [Thermoproteota archaeon]